MITAGMGSLTLPIAFQITVVIAMMGAVIIAAVYDDTAGAS